MIGWPAFIICIFSVVVVVYLYQQEDYYEIAAIVCADHGGGVLKGGAYSSVQHALCEDGTVYHVRDGRVYR